MNGVHVRHGLRTFEHLATERSACIIVNDSYVSQLWSRRSNSVRAHRRIPIFADWIWQVFFPDKCSAIGCCCDSLAGCECVSMRSHAFLQQEKGKLIRTVFAGLTEYSLFIPHGTAFERHFFPDINKLKFPVFPEWILGRLYGVRRLSDYRIRLFDEAIKKPCSIPNGPSKIWEKNQAIMFVLAKQKKI